MKEYIEENFANLVIRMSDEKAMKSTFALLFFPLVICSAVYISGYMVIPTGILSYGLLIALVIVLAAAAIAIKEDVKDIVEGFKEYGEEKGITRENLGHLKTKFLSQINSETKNLNSETKFSGKTNSETKKRKKNEDVDKISTEADRMLQKKEKLYKMELNVANKVSKKRKGTKAKESPADLETIEALFFDADIKNQSK